MQSNLMSLILLLALVSCAKFQGSEKEYDYPRSNTYPDVFKTVYDKDFGELLLVELKASTVKFECSKRNDQPYFWCGIDSELAKAVEGHPSKLETIFHVQIPKWGVRNVQKLLKVIKKRSKKITVVVHRNPRIDKKRNSFWSQLFLFYDNASCVAFLGTENLCPSGAKVEDIYLK